MSDATTTGEEVPSVDHGARGHAPLGGSQAHIYLNCPGSVFLKQELPEQPPSPKMLEGTEGHEVAEVLLTDFLQYKLEGDIDWEIRAAAIAKNIEMLTCAEGYVETIWKEVLQESITGKSYGIEDRFVINEQLGMAGFIDFWSIYVNDRAKRVGWIIDYKYGSYPVAAEGNSQLAFYAVAMLEEVRRLGKDLDLVKAGIYQPRAHGKEPFLYTEFTAKELETWKKKFYKVAEQIYIKKKPIFKVGHWCELCSARGVCKTYAKTLSTKTSLALVDPEIVVLPKVEQLSKEQRVRLILHADAISDLLSAVKSVTIEEISRGQKFEGIKAVEGSSRRKWKDDKALISATLATHGIEPYRSELKNLTDCEKELARSMSKQGAREIIDTLCDMTTPPTLLVVESDPRPSIKGNVQCLTPLTKEEIDGN